MSLATPRWVRAALVMLGVAGIVVAIVTVVDPPPVEIQYVVSTDAEELLQPIVEQFNEDDVTVNGHPIDVELVPVASGTAATAIAEGRLAPTAWTPASSLWVRLLKHRRGDAVIGSLPGSIVQSPEVFAVFESSLERYGLNSQSKFAAVLEATQHGFRLGHTDPNSSTSGLFAVLGEFTIAAETMAEGELTTDGVDRVAGAVQDIESRIEHYVDIGRDFNKEWCKYGHDFADGGYMQETILHELNKQDCEPIVPIYPRDLRYQADYPFAVLRAGTSDPQRQAAEKLRHYVDKELLDDDCARVAKEAFRKPGCRGKAKPLVNPRSWNPPPTPALAALQGKWRELRRPATVMLVVDESTSMANEGRFGRMKEALLEGTEDQKPFVGCLSPQDRLGVVTFGGEFSPELHAPLRTFDESVARERIAALETGNGQRTLYDALQWALMTDGMRSLERINTVVLLTNGGNDRGEIGAHDVEDLLQAKPPVQVVAVSYDETNDEFRDSVIDKSIGRLFEGDPRNTAEVAKFLCGFL